jgi:hypothetical protein
MTRGTRRKMRQDVDVYPTPGWCVRRLMEAATLPTCGTWLEPAVGDGAIIRIIRQYYPRVMWHTNDIRPESLLHAGMNHTATHYTGDFLELAPAITVPYECVVTNPPFSLAFEFVKASLPIADNVVMLLRLGFLESSGRNSWIRQHMPDYVYILPNRQGGTSDGKTDVFTYAWFHWKPSYVNSVLEPTTSSIMTVLPDTPIAERKKDRELLAVQRPHNAEENV